MNEGQLIETTGEVEYVSQKTDDQSKEIVSFVGLIGRGFKCSTKIPNEMAAKLKEGMKVVAKNKFRIWDGQLKLGELVSLQPAVPIAGRAAA
jgi:hypothetical protein